MTIIQRACRAIVFLLWPFIAFACAILIGELAWWAVEQLYKTYPHLWHAELVYKVSPLFLDDKIFSIWCLASLTSLGITQLYNQYFQKLRWPLTLWFYTGMLLPINLFLVSLTIFFIPVVLLIGTALHYIECKWPAVSKYIHISGIVVFSIIPILYFVSEVRETYTTLAVAKKDGEISYEINSIKEKFAKFSKVSPENIIINSLDSNYDNEYIYEAEFPSGTVIEQKLAYHIHINNSYTGTFLTCENSQIFGIWQIDGQLQPVLIDNNGKEIFQNIEYKSYQECQDDWVKRKRIKHDKL